MVADLGGGGGHGYLLRSSPRNSTLHSHYHLSQSGPSFLTISHLWSYALVKLESGPSLGNYRLSQGQERLEEGDADIRT